ncbi:MULTISPECIES: hypothetical protein [unclassified Streptomyces]|uniref:hypothetical protein n=1 Tax=unclassified Streptomyces TaxID=2593676 RepID=UPI002E2B555D|nr:MULTISPECIES: hypothetical protein [unclassified Streptomyces]
MTTALYEIVTTEAADGTTHPAEQIWPPSEDAKTYGFLAHGGVHITGIGGPADDESVFPAAFVALGHQPWAAVIKAAAAYMDRVHGWRNLHLYPGDDPAELIPRIPRAVHTHAVILSHPHPDHPCGCEWENTWRLVYAPPTEPGAIPITVMRHPAAQATAAAIPSPDHGPVPATWAH